MVDNGLEVTEDNWTKGYEGQGTISYIAFISSYSELLKDFDINHKVVSVKYIELTTPV